MQFSLRSLFAATALIACACAAVKYIVQPSDPMGGVIAWFSIPVFLCGAIGVLRGRLRFWLGYGIAIDLLVMGFTMLAGM
jgi:hypothetical protein